MDKSSMAFLSENTSTACVNASHSVVSITSINATIASFIFVGFLVGASLNGLFLWVLGLKMKRTVNTLWFFHLILTYLISCFLLPFFAVFVLFDYHWIFGTIMCKILMSILSVVKFTTIFLLTIISLDRYVFTCHSSWSQRYRTVPRARRLVAGVWLISSALSVPKLFSLETQEVAGKRQCDHSFVFSNNWAGFHLQMGFFLVNFFLAFLFPFLIIMGCYGLIGHEMKKKQLVRTRKPFRILVAAVASFFICWIPYHIYDASRLLGRTSETINHVLFDIAAAGGCFNICFTPIIYLLVGEKFQKVFKTSIMKPILALFRESFVDYPIIPRSNDNTAEELHYIHGKTSKELKVIQRNQLSGP